MSYETIKKGRKITGLKFLISEAQQATEKSKKSAKQTKNGRPKLPKRPPVKAGTHEEGVYIRECEYIIRTYWKSVHQGLEWLEILPKLPESELELLEKFYKAIGDVYYQHCRKILAERTKNKTA